MNTESYYKKYLKYKNKYIKLNNELKQIGGQTDISVKTIKDALESIETISYEIFKLNFSREEKNTIKLLNIDTTDSTPTTFNFYENINDLINNDNQELDNLVKFIELIGTNSYETATKMSCIIKNISSLLEQGYNKKYCWLTIRVQKKTTAYKIPRWHCDGNYFNKNSYPYPQTKFIMVLKGPGTLLIKPDDKVKEVYNNFIYGLAQKSQHETIDDRELLDKELNDNGAQQIQLGNDKGLIFLAGHSNCTIHSEPDITEPRMFLSVVFADEHNINEWRLKSIRK